MKVLVIGAGLAGLSTSLELARRGHQVCVIERHAGVAAEGSFANGGLLASSYLAAWGAPGWPTRCLDGVGGPGWGRAAWRPTHWRFLWRQRRAQAASARSQQRDGLLALGRASRERLAQLTQQLRLEHEHADGLLVVLRHERELDALGEGLAWLSAHGLSHQVLSAEQARTLEPALNADTPLHAALHLPGDAAANSRQFAHLLKQAAQAAGVQWRFQHEVLGIAPGQPVQVRVRRRPDLLDGQAQAGPEEVLSADAVVVCAADGAPALLTPLGLDLPLATVQGHSITAPLRLDESLHERLPRAAVLDQHQQISIARQGDRVRVAGGALLGRRGGAPQPGSLRRLYQALDRWFPGAAHTVRAIEWCGPRLATPDALPLIGPSGQPGVWLNTAHAASGWTLACGAAEWLARQVSAEAVPSEASAFSVDRLR